MTGVSKFSKVSIFSNLNNLTDITMDQRFSSLLGYTHEEVRSYFPGRLEALAKMLGTDADGAFTRLVSMYDGYCFDRSIHGCSIPCRWVAASTPLSSARIGSRRGRRAGLCPMQKNGPSTLTIYRSAARTWGRLSQPTPPCPPSFSKQDTSRSRKCGDKAWARCIRSGFPTRRLRRALTAGSPTPTLNLGLTFRRQAAGPRRVCAPLPQGMPSVL